MSEMTRNKVLTIHGRLKGDLRLINFLALVGWKEISPVAVVLNSICVPGILCNLCGVCFIGYRKSKEFSSSQEDLLSSRNGDLER